MCLVDKSVFNLAKKNYMFYFLYLEDFNIKSKIIIFCLIICLLIPLSTVSASDINNTADDQVLSATPSVDTLSASVNPEQKNDTLSVNDENLLSAGPNSGNDNLLGADDDSNYGSFSDLVDLISLNPESVKLVQNYKYQTGDEAYLHGITINKNNYVIDGNGFTIDGSKQANIFLISSDNVILKNITITNSNTQYGEVICFLGNNGLIDNVTITNSSTADINESYMSGFSSFVIFYGENGVFNNSKIINCQIISSKSTGGFITTWGANLVISNSEIINSTVSSPYDFWSHLIGLPVASGSNHTITNCNFTGNTASGLLHLQRNGVTINDSNISNNNFKANIFSNEGMFEILNNVTFSGNTKTNIAFTTSKKLVLNNCTFEDEYCYLASNLLKSLNVTDTVFKNIKNNKFFTTATYIGDGFNFVGCSFINMTSSLIINPSVGSVKDCSFINITTTNTAPLVLTGNYITVSGNTFKNTTGTSFNAINNIGENYIDNTNQFLDMPDNGKENVNNTGTIFADYSKIYVSVDGTGEGLSDQDYTNFTYAMSKVFAGGTIFFKPGTYELGINRYDLYCSLIGLDDGVIINNASFYMKSLGLTIENITFNHTSTNGFVYTPFSSIKHVNFNNSQVIDYIIINDGNVDDTELIDLNFTNCVKKSENPYIMRLGDHGKASNINIIKCIGFNQLIAFQNFANAFELNEITVNESKFNYFYYINSEDRNGRTENIYLYNNEINSDVFGNLRPQQGNVLNGFTAVNNTMKQTNSLISYIPNSAALTPGIVGFSYIDRIFLKNNTLASQILNVFTNSFTLKNSHVENMSLNNLIIGNGSVNLDNVNITNVTLNAVADSLVGVNRLNITNTLISNNLTVSGNIVGSVFDNMTGHVIINGANIRVSNSEFKNMNNSLLNGSAVYLDGSYVTFDNVNFTNNTGKNGALYVTNTSTRPSLVNVNFTENYASEMAGALYIQSLYDSEGRESSFPLGMSGVTNSTINHTAGNNGCYNGMKANIAQLVKKVYVTNDTTKSGESGESIEHATTFNRAYNIADSGCEFIFVDDGGIFDYTNSTLYPGMYNLLMPSQGRDWKFVGCNTVISGLRFLVTELGSGLSASNITFKNTEDSVVIINGSNVKFENCKFINATSDVSEFGALRVLADNVTIIDCKFADNTIPTNTSLEFGFGGGVYVNATNVTISGCTFDNNTAQEGSHIYVTKDSIIINIIDNTFSNASTSGAGKSSVRLSGSVINLKGNTFSDNKDSVALSIMETLTEATISGNTFDSNSNYRSGTGGALYLEYSNTVGTNRIIDNHFLNNNATLGGAAYIKNVDDKFLTLNGTFTGNRATSGGAIYIDDESFALSDITFSDNTAVDGGAIYVNQKGVRLSDLTFIGNNATKGGAVYINNDNVVLIGNTFNGNNATDGGALYVDGNNTRVIDSNFNGNNASERGSAIYLADNQIISLSNIQLINNKGQYDNPGDKEYDDISYAYILPGINGNLNVDRGSDSVYYINRTAITSYSEVYITNGGTGTGGIKDPTNWENAIAKILKDGIIYIVCDNFKVNNTMVELLKNANLTNVTIVGINKTKITRDSDVGKYLFILSIFEDYFKILVMLLFCRYSLSLILSCLIL